MERIATAEQVVAVAMRDLLLDAGVSTWFCYEDALESYEPTGDEYTDAVAFVSALESIGVDSWELYGGAIQGISDYSEYVRSLEDPSAAISIESWKGQAD